MPLWAKHNSEYFQVFEEHGRFYFIDARISRAALPTTASIINSDKKPSPTQEAKSPVGTKKGLILKYYFTGVVEQSNPGNDLEPPDTGYSADPDCFHIDISDLEFTDVKIEIKAIFGGGCSHICEWCKQFVANNPDKDAPCKGCHRAAWAAWGGFPAWVKLGVIE